MSAQLGSTNPAHHHDTATFTCEVCKISVRSAQKLLDHVNFSPLHKAALEGGKPSGGAGTGINKRLSPAKRASQRRILYDGTKLFWRINETLELGIYEDVGANCITVAAFHQDDDAGNPSTEPDIPSLLLDRTSLLDAVAMTVGLPPPSTAKDPPKAVTPSSPRSSDRIVKFILERLHAGKDPHSSIIAISLHKLKASERDVALLVSQSQQQQHHPQVLVTSDISVRRRHTYDQVQTAQTDARTAALELRQARLQAESLSNMTRVTLNSFSRRKSTDPARALSHNRSEWLHAYDRVAFKNAVTHSRVTLQTQAEAEAAAAAATSSTSASLR